jgi:hypothetical protein
MVVVTYSSWNAATRSAEVGAYVSGPVEAGGTCTLRLTGPGSGGLTSSVPATADATTTTCGELALTGLSPGTWQGEVGYRSSGWTGQSAPFTLSVP